jgi:uncharacterized protein with PIN domain
MQPGKDEQAPISFTAESTLGRLSRWLRLAGFDTVYDRRPPDARLLAALAPKPGRIILTRTRSIADQMCRLHGIQSLFISCDDPLDQAKCVVKRLGIRRGDLNPLSRCVLCNQPLLPLSKDDAASRVPDYVIQNHCHFRCCPKCRRTYWSGTHTSQALQLIDRFFA